MPRTGTAKPTPAAKPTPDVTAVNERAHILSLQLQQQALSARIEAAIRSYGRPTPQQQLHELLRRGILHADLAAAREEVAHLNALLDRLQAGRSAGSAATSSALSAAPAAPARRAPADLLASPTQIATRARGSKQFAALAVEHVKHWLDQAREAVLLLEDLVQPGSIDEWCVEPPEPPPPRPHGPPVAHFIQRIPPELASCMTLPSTSYQQLLPASAASATACGWCCGCCGGNCGGGGGVPPVPAAAVAGAGVLWGAAPLLRDPATGVCYRVALHDSAELMCASEGHISSADVVLLLPGRYNWPEGTVALRAAVRVLGLGRQPGDVVIHNNEEDDVFVECSAGPGPGQGPGQGQGQGHATDPAAPDPGAAAAGSAAASSGMAGSDAAAAPGQPGAGGGADGGRAAAAPVAVSPAELCGVTLENVTLLQLGGYEGALRVLRGRTTLVDVVVQFARGGVQVDGGAHLVMRNCRVVGGATAAVAVSAGGVLELQGGCEVARSGCGDDVVPKDLGGVELTVQLADYPRLPAAPCPLAIIEAHKAELSRPARDGAPLAALHPNHHQPHDASPSAPATPRGGVGQSAAAFAPPPAAAATAAATSGKMSMGRSCSASTAEAAAAAAKHRRGASESSGSRESERLEQQQQQCGLAGQPLLLPLERLPERLGSLQPPPTVVLGPGCTVQNTRGFAISVVKKRALTLYHQVAFGGPGGGGGGGSTSGGAGSGGGGGGGAGAASSASGSGGGGGGSGACSLAAALEGCRLLVARGASVGNGNTRGALGVVEQEYHVLDGDAVNRRTASRHFHPVQLSARQLQEGFASPGVDWTATRIRLEASPARPGSRATKLAIAATAAAAAAAAAAEAPASSPWRNRQRPVQRQRRRRRTRVRPWGLRRRAG